MLFRFIRHRFLVFTIIIFAIHLLIRLFFTDSLEIDEAEQVFLSQKFALGYNQQPPLYTWVIILLTKVFGFNIFSIIIFRLVLLVGTFQLVYKIAKTQVKQDIIAIMASLGMFLFFQLSIESLRQTHTVLLTFVVALLFYRFLKFLKTPSILNYLYLGLVMALGLYAKYNFMIILIAFIISACFNTGYRKYILSRKFLISVITFLAFTAVHLVWLFYHIDGAVDDTVKDLAGTEKVPFYKAGLFSIWTFLKAGLSFSGIFLLITLIVYRKYGMDLFQKEKQNFTSFLGRFIVVSLGILMCIVVFTKATNTHERWVQPILFLLPLYIFLKLDKFQNINFKRYYRALVIVGVASLTYVGFSIVLGPYFGFTERINRPYKMFASHLAEDPMIKLKEDGVIICDAIDLAGNLKYQLPGIKVDYWEKGKGLFYNDSEILGAKSVFLISANPNHEVFSTYVLNLFNEEASTERSSPSFYFKRSSKKKYKFFVTKIKLKTKKEAI